jgi:hypothetical protein
MATPNDRHNAGTRHSPSRTGGPRTRPDLVVEVSGPCGTNP